MFKNQNQMHPENWLNLYNEKLTIEIRPLFETKEYFP